jgi:two-component system, chemotaxis family, response regulator Rcp1
MRGRDEEYGSIPDGGGAVRFISRSRLGDRTAMNDIANGKPIEILLVEDNPGDVRLTMEALRGGRVRNNIHVVEDGVQAIDFLRRQGNYGDVPRPDLILLDLNLPKKDGREVLAEVKQDPALKRIPVVILTSSAAEQDILQAYDLAANCYITKPVELDQFLRVLKSIEDFWLVIVKLPPV